MLPLLLALTASAAAAAPADVIRVGGPSAPGDTKIAIVAGGHSFVGQTFTVTDQSGTTVTSGTLEPAPGGVGPWPFAARADLSSVHTPVATWCTWARCRLTVPGLFAPPGVAPRFV